MQQIRELRRDGARIHNKVAYYAMTRRRLKSNDMVVGTDKAVVSTNPIDCLWAAQCLCSSLVVRSTDPQKPGMGLLHFSSQYSDGTLLAAECVRPELTLQELEMLGRGQAIPTFEVSVEGALRGISTVLANKGIRRESQELVVMPNESYTPQNPQHPINSVHLPMVERLQADGFFF